MEQNLLSYNNFIGNFRESPAFKGYQLKYILQLNTSANIKFFKDELTIKYVGKGVSNNDYAVSNIYNFF